MTIRNQFRILLAKKADKENRNIPLREVQRETGISLTTLSQWANNKATRFDASTIETLCLYLECTPGDLFILVPDK